MIVYRAFISQNSFDDKEPLELKAEGDRLFTNKSEAIQTVKETLVRYAVWGEKGWIVPCVLEEMALEYIECGEE